MLSRTPRLKSSPLLTIFLLCCLLLPSFTTQPNVVAQPTLTAQAGYNITDSNDQDGIIYDWIDASVEGTKIVFAEEDSVKAIQLPFSFTLCSGQASDQLLVSDNGSILFGTNDENNKVPYNNQSLELHDTPNGLIAPFWDDLSYDTGAIYTKTIGNAPHRRFVVEWYNRTFYSKVQQYGGITFELILYENTNNIKFQYQDTLFGSDSRDNGASATVGLRCNNGDYQQYVNEPLVQDEQAICFQPSGQTQSCDSQPVENLFISDQSDGYYTIYDGKPITVTLTANVGPATVLTPVTYNWQPTPAITQTLDNTSEEARIVWDSPGTKYITVTAHNATKAKPVTKIHKIEVRDGSAPTLSFVKETTTVTEDVGVAKVAVKLNPVFLDNTTEVTVTCSTASPDIEPEIETIARAIQDYITIPITYQTLTFAPGTTTKTCKIPIVDDYFAEQNETFAVVLSNASPTSVLPAGPITATVEIIDNDPEVFVNFEQDQFRINEDAGDAPINVTLSQSANVTVTVDYATSDSTARSSSDYRKTTGTLTFPPGKTSATFTVPITSDTRLEGSESVRLRLSNVSKAAKIGNARAELSILDVFPSDSPSPVESIIQFSSPEYFIEEDNKEGEKIIEVERIGNPDIPLMVDVATFDGTATSRIDYGQTFKTLKFAKGTTNITFTVPITKDSMIEGDETIILTLNNLVSTDPLFSADKFNLGTQQTVLLTIQDDDATEHGIIQIETSKLYVGETDGTVYLEANRIGGYTGDVSVWVSTEDDLAILGEDFDEAHNPVVFPDGSSEPQTISIPIRNDNDREGDETFFVSLQIREGEAVLGAQSETEITIIDDDFVSPGTIQFVQRNYLVKETSKEATILIERIGGSNGDVSIDYATGLNTEAPNAATPGIDYTSVRGRITFEDGVTSKSFLVPIQQDFVVEGIEKIGMVLGNGDAVTETTHVRRLTAQDESPLPVEATGRYATLSIEDPELNSAGTISFERSEFSIGEGDGTATITLTIDPVIKEDGRQVSVECNSGPARTDPATVGDDYVEVSEIITFKQYELSKPCEVQIIDDTIKEGKESVALYLEKQTSGIGVGTNFANLSITDNDSTSEGPNIDVAYLTTSSPNMMGGQAVQLVAEVLQDDGNGNMVPVPNLTQVEVLINNDRTNRRTLHDDGTHGDFKEGDGMYSNFVTSKSLKNNQVLFSLYVGNTLIEGSEMVLQSVPAPELLVITDWKQLYEEFLDTKKNDEDENSYIHPDRKDHTHDFFDLIDRIQQYAKAHNGVVVDLPIIIRKVNGFPIDYGTINYEDGLDERKKQGDWINVLIKTIANQTDKSIKNIAIIGDDQVVPFYRVFDPSDKYTNSKYPNYKSYERNYCVIHNCNPEGNAVLEDMKEAYIMSDVPYSTSDSNSEYKLFNEGEDADWASSGEPSLFTVPDMGIGRIFAHRPKELIQAIDRYEQPLSLNSENKKAGVFGGQDKTASDFFEKRIRRSFQETLTSKFLDQERLYWNIGIDWFPDIDIFKNTFKQVLEQAVLVSLWAHASHTFVELNSDGSLYLKSNDITPDLNQQHPLLFTSLGCNMGLSVSYPNNALSKDYDLFHNTLALSFIEQGITVFAPTSFAYTYDESKVNSPNLHELQVKLFTTNALDNVEIETIGELWKTVLSDYHTEDPIITHRENINSRRFHFTSAYGVVLYGLPTQLITQIPDQKTPAGKPICEKVPTQPALENQQPELQSSAKTKQFSIDVPAIETLPMPDGTTLINLPGDAGQMVSPDGSPLPLLVHTQVIPDDFIVTGVNLVESESKQHPERITLAHPTLQTTNGNIVTTTLQLPDVYPSQMYTYTITPLDGASLLKLSIIPVQYVEKTQELTVYTHFKFEIDMMDMNILNNLKWNNAQSNSTNILRTSEIKIPETLRIGEQNFFEIEIDSSLADTIRLGWFIREKSGHIASSGLGEDLSVDAGGTTYRCYLDSSDWKPGDKDIEVSITNKDSSPSENAQFKAQGIGIKPYINTSIEISPTLATWYLKVYDENNGTNRFTSDVFTVTLTSLSDNTSLVESSSSIIATKAITPGVYILTYPLESVATGTYQVCIEASDTRGIIGKYETMIFVPEQEKQDPGTTDPTEPEIPNVYIPIITNYLSPTTTVETPTVVPTPVSLLNQR